MELITIGDDRYMVLEKVSVDSGYSIEELKSMDEVLPRPSPDAQKELLDRVRAGSNEAPADVESEFKDNGEKKW